MDSQLRKGRIQIATTITRVNCLRRFGRHAEPAKEIRMEDIQTNEKNETEERLPDLSVSTEQADEAKGGSISLNYTKITFNNVGMGSANE